MACCTWRAILGPSRPRPRIRQNPPIRSYEDQQSAWPRRFVKSRCGCDPRLIRNDPLAWRAGRRRKISFSPAFPAPVPGEDQPPQVRKHAAENGRALQSNRHYWLRGRRRRACRATIPAAPRAPISNFPGWERSNRLPPRQAHLPSSATVNVCSPAMGRFSTTASTRRGRHGTASRRPQLHHYRGVAFLAGCTMVPSA
jgi:hypothetical protein